MKTKQISLTFLILAGILLSGCVHREAIVKNYYLIQAPRPEKASPETSFEAVVSVEPFAIGPGYQSKGLVYQLGSNQFDTDYYNEYFISPSQMITDQTETWIRDSALFTRVVPPTSIVESTLLLEGDIRRLCYDIQDDEKMQASLAITFYLISKEGRRPSAIEFARTYQVSHAIARKDQQMAVDAMAVCLTEILEQLEQDLAAHLKNMQ